MSDWTSEFGGESLLAQDNWEAKEAGRNFRTGVWITKDGREMAIKDMEDGHLFNAYRHTQDKRLFHEMVLRLFEAKLKEKNR